MFNKPTPVPKVDSSALTIDDLPPANPCWRDIVKFCATFDIRAEFGERCGVRGVIDVSPDSSIAEMRAGLWCDYRRWNHFGREPDDDDTFPKAVQVCSWIRSKVSES